MNSNDQVLAGMLHITPSTTKPDSLIDQLIFEYDQLRKETLQTDVITLQILAGVLVITTALMSLAFSDKISPNELKSTLFFMTEIVGFIGLLQNTDRVKSTIIIASYIKNFIEPIINVKWETRLHRFRSLRPKDMSMNMMTQQRLVYMVIIFANFALWSYHLWLAYANIFTLVAISVGFIISLSLFILEWRKYNYTNFEGVQEYDRVWQSIRDEER